MLTRRLFSSFSSSSSRLTMSDLKEAQSLVDFVNLSPSPFHAVAELSRGFEAAGFKRIYEDDSWNLEKAGNYFFTRNQSSLIAFSVGKQYQPGNGFSIVAAHTDSPCLKLKPRTKKESQKFEQLAVQTYGGGLWHTWFDRDLGLAGRVIVREEGKYVSKLINITRPILRIPSLCIHLGREVSEAFKFNFETHLIPVIGGVAPKSGDSSSSSSSSSEEKVGEEHYSLARDASGTNSETLLDLICAELSVKRDQIAEIELCLADTQPGTLAGAHNEFIFSARLDNLFNCYTGMKSLINSSGDLDSEKNIRVAAFFDNEEVGSVSNAGADSILMEQTIHRCIHGVNGSSPLPADIYERSLRRSFLISADMAHACHPNYSEKHESAHQPRFDQGLVIKTNANMRYATNSATALIIHHLSKQYNVPTQEFVVKNDSACGSTIGPSLSARGLRTVDVGCAQLSMHSIREMCGSADAALAVRLFEGFFKSFAEVDETILIDRAI